MVWVRLAELLGIEGRPVSADTMYKRVGEKIFVTFEFLRGILIRVMILERFSFL